MGSNQQLCLATSVAKQLKIMPKSGSQNPILYLSVQKNPYHNPPGKFTSVVIDCERRNLMPNYPRNVTEKPKEKTVKSSPTSIWSHGYVVSYLHLPRIRHGINETTEEVGQNNLITSYDISALKEVARLV